MTPTEPDLPGTVDTESEKAVKPSLKALGIRGLFATLPIVTFTISIFWSAIQSIFLAIQVQNIDLVGQAGALALVVGVGAVGSMVMGPIAGRLSDRTRTRLGGRVPWMIVGLLLSVTFAILLASATTIAELTIYWVGLQMATGLIVTPLTAHIPSQVPLVRRGGFSALNGMASLVGAIAGQIIGGSFAAAITTGYFVVVGLITAAVILFVLTNHKSNLGEPKPAFDLTGLLRTFWVNPRQHPDFAWVFAGRFLLFSGYFAVSSYQLYLLQSYIGLGESAAATVGLIGLAGLAGMVLSTVIGGILVDRIGKTKVLLYVTSGVLALGLIVPLFVPTLEGMLIYALITGLGFGAYQSIDFVLVTQVLPSDEESGKDLGIINITSSLPQTIGVAIAGLIVTITGTYAAIFPFAAGAVILGAVLLIPVKIKR